MSLLQKAAEARALLSIRLETWLSRGTRSNIALTTANAWRMLFWESLRERRVASSPRDLQRFEQVQFSQNGEDGILQEIFARIGEGAKRCVEIAAGDGSENCTRALVEKGWDAVWVEADSAKAEQAKRAGEGKRVRVLADRIDRDNAVALMNHAVPDRALDLLVMDIDGNDYWICEKILAAGFAPRVCVVEYNAAFEPGSDWVMPYDPNHNWDGSYYFGANLDAYCRLFTANQYSLVACDSHGVNAFFVRDDLLGEHFDRPSKHAFWHYSAPRYDREHFGHPRQRAPKKPSVGAQTRTSEEVRDLYTKDYFLTDCGGFTGYAESGGKALTDTRLGAAADIAAYTTPKNVLDVGCGRGELVYYYRKHLQASVTGVDYSNDALTLARSCFTGEEQLLDRVALVNADASRLVLSEMFDLMLATDLIEHLGFTELARVYATLSTHLTRDGIFVGHTFPNRWHYQYGYRRRRRKALAAGQYLPEEPRSQYELAMHINEQSPAILKRQLRKSFAHVELWFSYGDPGGSLVAPFTRSEMMDAPSLFFVASHEPIDKQRLSRLLMAPKLSATEVKDISVSVPEVPSSLRVDEVTTLPVTVSNGSAVALGTRGAFPLYVSYHWVNESVPEASIAEGLRTAIFPSISTGERTIRCTVKAPAEAGEFKLVMTLVQESVAWLETLRPELASSYAVKIVERGH